MSSPGGAGTRRIPVRSFVVGQRIQALWKGYGKKRYPGVILSISAPPGRYNILFDDGDTEKNVRPQSIWPFEDPVDIQVDLAEESGGAGTKKNNAPVRIVGESDDDSMAGVDFSLDVDGHHTMCCYCGDGGDILLCDFCPKVYHSECLKTLGAGQPPEEGQWKCPPCCGTPLSQDSAYNSWRVLVRRKRQSELLRRESSGVSDRMGKATGDHAMVAAADILDFTAKRAKVFEPPPRTRGGKFPVCLAPGKQGCVLVSNGSLCVWAPPSLPWRGTVIEAPKDSGLDQSSSEAAMALRAPNSIWIVNWSTLFNGKRLTSVKELHRKLHGSEEESDALLAGGAKANEDGGEEEWGWGVEEETEGAKDGTEHLSEKNEGGRNKATGKAGNFSPEVGYSSGSVTEPGSAFSGILARGESCGEGKRARQSTTRFVPEIGSRKKRREGQIMEVESGVPPSESLSIPLGNDAHVFACSACEEGGVKLMLCESCHRVMHAKCAPGLKGKVPQWAWMCPVCEGAGKGYNTDIDEHYRARERNGVCWYEDVLRLKLSEVRTAAWDFMGMAGMLSKAYFRVPQSLFSRLPWEEFKKEGEISVHIGGPQGSGYGALKEHATAKSRKMRYGTSLHDAWVSNPIITPSQSLTKSSIDPEAHPALKLARPYSISAFNVNVKVKEEKIRLADILGVSTTSTSKQSISSGLGLFDSWEEKMGHASANPETCETSDLWERGSLMSEESTNLPAGVRSPKIDFKESSKAVETFALEGLDVDIDESASPNTDQLIPFNERVDDSIPSEEGNKLAEGCVIVGGFEFPQSLVNASHPGCSSCQFCGLSGDDLVQCPICSNWAHAQCDPELCVPWQTQVYNKSPNIVAANTPLPPPTSYLSYREGSETYGACCGSCLLHVRILRHLDKAYSDVQKGLDMAFVKSEDKTMDQICQNLSQPLIDLTISRTLWAVVSPTTKFDSSLRALYFPPPSNLIYRGSYKNVSLSLLLDKFSCGAYRWCNRQTPLSKKEGPPCSVFQEASISTLHPLALFIFLQDLAKLLTMPFVDMLSPDGKLPTAGTVSSLHEKAVSTGGAYFIASFEASLIDSHSILLSVMSLATKNNRDKVNQAVPGILRSMCALMEEGFGKMSDLLANAFISSVQEDSSVLSRVLLPPISLQPTRTLSLALKLPLGDIATEAYISLLTGLAKSRDLLAGPSGLEVGLHSVEVSGEESAAAQESISTALPAPIVDHDAIRERLQSRPNDHDWVMTSSLRDVGVSADLSRETSLLFSEVLGFLRARRIGVGSARKDSDTPTPLDAHILDIFFPSLVSASLGPHSIPGAGIVTLEPSGTGSYNLFPLSTQQAVSSPTRADDEFTGAIATAPPPFSPLQQPRVALSPLRDVIQGVSRCSPPLLPPKPVAVFHGDPYACDGCRYGWNHICAFSTSRCPVYEDGTVKPPSLPAPNHHHPLNPPVNPTLSAAHCPPNFSISNGLASGADMLDTLHPHLNPVARDARLLLVSSLLHAAAAKDPRLAGGCLTPRGSGGSSSVSERDAEEERGVGRDEGEIEGHLARASLEAVRSSVLRYMALMSHGTLFPQQNHHHHHHHHQFQGAQYSSPPISREESAVFTYLHLRLSILPAHTALELLSSLSSLLEGNQSTPSHEVVVSKLALIISFMKLLWTDSLGATSTLAAAVNPSSSSSSGKSIPAPSSFLADLLTSSLCNPQSHRGGITHVPPTAASPMPVPVPVPEPEKVQHVSCSSSSSSLDSDKEADDLHTLLHFLDSPLPSDILRDPDFLKLVPETFARRLLTSSSPPPTLRMAIRATPGNEDALFSAATLRSAAAAIAGSSPYGAGGSGGGQVSALLFLYGALRYWRRLHSFPGATTAPMSPPAPPPPPPPPPSHDDGPSTQTTTTQLITSFSHAPRGTSRLISRSEALHRRDALNTVSSGASSRSQFTLPRVVSSLAAVVTGSSKRQEEQWGAFQLPRAVLRSPPPKSITGFPIPSIIPAPILPHPPWSAATSGLSSLLRRAHRQASFLYLGRSRIDGTGLFTSIPIEAEDVVAEYTGEIVGDAVCDQREIYYRRWVLQQIDA